LEALDISPYNSPDDLYIWAIPRANISCPYLSLKEATGKIISAYSAPQQWGYCSDGKFRIPNPELIPDYKPWRLFIEFIQYNMPDKLEIIDYVPSSFTELETTDYLKYPNLERVLKRIIELSKSPLSATLRNSKEEIDMLKNAVDFVFLEHIYISDNEKYKNLTLSGLAVTSGRRSVVTEHKVEGKRLSSITTFNGYKISNYLRDHIADSSSKNPEQDTFVHFVLSLIRCLVPSGEVMKNYQLPKVFFEVPSVQLRHAIRQGPQIRTKKGLKYNLYVPLSCVKSSECSGIPEVIKKDCIDLGAKVLRKLDKINVLSPKESSEKLPLFREYLTFCYIVNDEIRSQWVKNLMTPSIVDLHQMIEGAYPEDKDYPSLEAISIAKVRLRTMKFSPVSDDKTVLSNYREVVNRVISKKQSRTGKFPI